MSGAVVQPDTGELTVLFTKPEAEAATAKLKSYFGVSCQLVKELHDKQAWKAMGYGSWAAYTKAEFDISRSRSYQLIKYAEVVAGLELHVRPAALDAGRGVVVHAELGEEGTLRVLQLVVVDGQPGVLGVRRRGAEEGHPCPCLGVGTGSTN